MKRLKIYYENYCPYCRMALALADKMNLDYDSIDCGDKPDLLKKIKAQTSHRTIPIILLDEKLIGGYTEFANLVQNEGLKDLVKK